MELKDIRSPRDIKGLTIDQLKQIAAQARQAILHRCSLIGGHVGPNLGVVEMTIAMHYVFDAPRDKLLFDVSHQDFTHKMLTGRVDGYLNEEDFAKVGEFTSPAESPEYDLFFGGHTSPMISLGCGISKARELNGDNYHIVALVGDGSLSGGEAFEGLNTAAQTKGNFVIIINDNQMAIAPDYGGLYGPLRELRETNGTASANIFRAFGLDYMYVAEGNDMATMIAALQKAKSCDHPIVVHVNTQKGQGYPYAEQYREAWHHRDPFDIATGALKSLPPSPDSDTMLRDFLLKKCAEVPNLLIVTSATPDYFGFGPQQRQQAGAHFIDVDIAEQTAASVMAGAAKVGAKVVYPAAASFLQRNYDQLMEDWAQNDCPALLVVQKSGLKGFTDETHLGWWDIPMLAAIPNLVYLAPATLEEFEAMLEWGLKQSQHKVAVRQPTYSIEHSTTPPATDYSQLNTFEMIHRGSRVALIAAGDWMVKGREIAHILASSGIDATLINPRYISGVDRDMLNALETDHELVVTLEDGSVDGGFGQRVAAALGLSPLKVLNFGLPKHFYDNFNADHLEETLELTAPQITRSILAAL